MTKTDANIAVTLGLTPSSKLSKHTQKPPDKTPSLIERHIVERIYSAVMEQQLAPGTKLSESMLCQSFAASRQTVRRALLLLGSQGIVDLHAHRGAFIAKPDRKQAHDVFDARLSLEPGIVRRVAKQASDSDLNVLAQHIAQEQQAKQARKRRDIIRLSGEFHIKLAQVTHNAVLTRMVRELVTRTSLIIGLFGTSGVSNCEEDEHQSLLRTLQQGDAIEADRLMREHLAHIEADLDLSADWDKPTDLTDILSRS